MGTFFVVIGLPALLAAHPHGRHQPAGAVAVLVGLVGIAIFARVRLIANRTGIEIRNPLSTVRLQWGEIESFRLGRHGLMSAVCVVKRKDGSATYSFAIQRALAGVGRQEMEMINQLNQLLTNRERL